MNSRASARFRSPQTSGWNLKPGAGRTRVGSAKACPSQGEAKHAVKVVSECLAALARPDHGECSRAVMMRHDASGNERTGEWIVSVLREKNHAAFGGESIPLALAAGHL